MVLNDSDPVKITSMEKEACKRKQVLPLTVSTCFLYMELIGVMGIMI